MRQIQLAAAIRQESGKGPARRLRVAGQVPAVIYGKGGNNSSLAVNTFELVKALGQTSGASALLSLSIEGESVARLAVLQELQTDSLGKKIQHVDFLEVRPDQELTVEVPLEFTGEAPGAADGGIVSINLYSVPVHGKVLDIPDSLMVDLSGLQMGEALHSSSLSVPATVAVAGDEDLLLVSCHRPAVESEAGEDGAEGAEGEAGETGE